MPDNPNAKPISVFPGQPSGSHRTGSLSSALKKFNDVKSELHMHRIQILEIESSTFAGKTRAWISEQHVQIEISDSTTTTLYECNFSTGHCSKNGRMATVSDSKMIRQLTGAIQIELDHGRASVNYVS